MRIRNSAALAAALGAFLAGTAAFAQSGRPPAGDTVTVGLGDRYASYYFDVSPAQSPASGLRPFAAKGGLKIMGGNLLLVHSLSDRPKGWSLFGIASYSRLQGDFASSPIVADAGSANQLFGAFGVGYTF